MTGGPVAVIDCFALLDDANECRHYSHSLQQQRETMQDSSRTPSARIIAEMRNNKEAFFPFSMRYSQQHAAHFRALPLSAEHVSFFQDVARQSVLDQQQIEALDTLSFDEFLTRYYAQR